MPRLLYFDCFSGAAGDMILGALLDAGLPLADLRAVIESLGVAGLSVDAEPVVRAGVKATKLRVRENDHDRSASLGSGHRHRHEEHHRDHEHDDHHHQDHQHHDHSHHAHTYDQPHGGRQETAVTSHQHPHPHRKLEDIDRLVNRSALSLRGKERAIALFRRLGEVEASIHGIPIEQVHFHEVGAIDSIVDIVGCVFGLERLKIDDCAASPLNVGSGTVDCEHGTFPVPAPATAALVRKIPIYSSGLQAELLTPTGALIVTGYARQFGPLPPMEVETIGYGAGERDFPTAPNVLRVLIGRATPDGSTERIVVLEFEVDDMNPQIFSLLMEKLYSEGALDVFFVSAQMKKNRPGTLVTVVAPPDRREPISALVFRETTTIGLRYHEMLRERLEREIMTVGTALGPAKVKVAKRAGAVVNASPEFEDCTRLAAAHGLPLKQVQALVMKAYLDIETGSR